MLFAPVTGGLEVRAGDNGEAVISGRFPYGAETELARGRFEVFAPGSLQVREDAYLLAAHDFARPLASRKAGSLTLTDTAEGLSFEARISPDVANTSHGRDTLALVRAGLSVGLSPGFRLTAGGDRVERRSDGVLRTVNKAELFELSIVTRPAYDSAQVEARNWRAELPADSIFQPGKPPIAYRYR